jgi:hypothetical protein
MRNPVEYSVIIEQDNTMSRCFMASSTGKGLFHPPKPSEAKISDSQQIFLKIMELLGGQWGLAILDREKTRLIEEKQFQSYSNEVHVASHPSDAIIGIYISPLSPKTSVIRDLILSTL